ncbi:hypothetical protein E2C01_027340 [Portunus trituberculatus]|uniref:Uncharacterized protein n=1 Tax=Portunus trituberculatus TaxID=210409 RepID=A0A5B7EHM7_PORTR|nr:hypothetical protein [Portunus trituberculatus]
MSPQEFAYLEAAFPGVSRHRGRLAFTMIMNLSGGARRHQRKARTSLQPGPLHLFTASARNQIPNQLKLHFYDYGGGVGVLEVVSFR